MYILAIDTSTKCLSLSLIDISKENCIAYYIEEEEENSHARKINLSIKDILEKCEIRMENLSAIALNEGPGSFTGLRVGSSTAKGLCYSLNLPLINICGLCAYARFLYELRVNDYSDVEGGDKLAMFSSLGNLEIAINGGKANELFGINIGDAIKIEYR